MDAMTLRSGAAAPIDNRAGVSSVQPSWLHTKAVRLWRGPDADPAWARPALLLLLFATGVLYFWNLTASGWANSFYTAAAQAGSESGAARLRDHLGGHERGALGARRPRAGHGAAGQTAGVAVATALSTVVRFTAMRRWIFRRDPA